MAEMIYRYKLDGMPKDKEFNQMPFGRRIEFFRKIEEFKAKAKKGYVDAKRRSPNTGIKEAVEGYEAVQWYCVYRKPDSCWKDDSFEFWYVKENS